MGRYYCISNDEQLYNNELMHRSHKYIRRYRGRNGKWVYEYYNPTIKLKYKSDNRKDAEKLDVSDIVYNKNSEKYNTNKKTSDALFKVRYDNSGEGSKMIRLQEVSELAKKYGANGMPSSVADLIGKMADKRLDEIIKSYK